VTRTKCGVLSLSSSSLLFFSAISEGEEGRIKRQHVFLLLLVFSLLCGFVLGVEEA